MYLLMKPSVIEKPNLVSRVIQATDCASDKARFQRARQALQTEAGCHHGNLSCRYPLMGGDLCCASCLEDALGLGHLVRCAVSDDEELVRLERRLVLHDAVFGNPNAVQPGA